MSRPDDVCDTMGLQSATNEKDSDIEGLNLKKISTDSSFSRKKSQLLIQKSLTLKTEEGPKVSSSSFPFTDQSHFSEKLFSLLRLKIRVG